MIAPNKMIFFSLEMYKYAKSIGDYAPCRILSFESLEIKIQFYFGL